MSLLLNAQSITKSYGTLTLFEDISFGIFRGDKIGIIGPNGSGKSTFLKVLAGLEPCDKGEVCNTRHLRIGFVPQKSLFSNFSVKEVLIETLHHQSFDEYECHTQASIILSKIGFEDPSQKASTLSGGWQKRLAIAQAIVLSPDLLFLDEPTNHLDLKSIIWLENFLQREKFTYALISHDRTFLQNVTTRTLELNKSYPKGLFSIDGSYNTFLEKRNDFLSGQVQYQKSLSSKVRREVDWLKQNPKARTTKSQSRIQQANKLIGELETVKRRNQKSTAQIDFSTTEKQSRKLLSAKNLSKSLGGNTLFSQINLPLHPGTKLGIVGSNGSGKTTLLKLLAKQEAPDTGTIKYAQDLQIVYFDQQRTKLSPSLSLREALSGGNDTIVYRGKSIHINNWCKRFLFLPDKLDLPISQFSGGEIARILIARLMLQPADILFLDEPTNDLDIPTLEILEESLSDFSGAVVIITHDRYILQKTCNLILGLGLSKNEYLFADYSQWEAFKKNSSLQQDSSSTKKVKQRPQAKRSPKLSYKEKQEWEQMEHKIFSLETTIDQLQKQVENPTAPTDTVSLQEKCKALKIAQDELESLYNRWQELEEKQFPKS